MHADNLIDVFAADGLLAHCLDNFAPRAEQGRHARATSSWAAQCRDVSRSSIALIASAAAANSCVTSPGSGSSIQAMWRWTAR